MNELTYAKAIEIADAYCDNEMPLAWKLNVLYNFELELMGGVMLLSQAEIDLVTEPTADTAATLTLTVKRPHAEICGWFARCMRSIANMPSLPT